MKKIIKYMKSNLMLSLSAIAAICSLFITKPSFELISDIDWRTLGNLTMMMAVLHGFKKEGIFNPIIRACCNLKSVKSVIFALVFSVFFSSMFVTNDVSLLVFVPLTISIFRTLNKEDYILPVITMENIAAVRGSLLTPFGSPQNLFLFGKYEISAFQFIKGMMPVCLLSAVLLIIFIFCLVHIKRGNNEIDSPLQSNCGSSGEFSIFNCRKIASIVLLVITIASITSRTRYWYFVLLIVLISVFVLDKKNIIEIDISLLLTFFCFFVFSSSIARNEKIALFFSSTVAKHEYFWSIALSQLISNVPSAIILQPFSENASRLIYGLDTAGLVSIIGSLASVINYRLYISEYRNNEKQFFKTFTLINLIFFAIVVIPGYLLSANDFFVNL